MIRHAPIAALLCAAVLSGCGSKVDRTVTGPAPAAKIKFFNFAVGSPGVNFYANETKVTAINSAAGQESPIGTSYGQVAAGGLYTAIAPGQYTFTGRLSDTTAANRGVKVSTLAQAIENGKSYSFYQSGIYSTATRSADAFIVEDSYTVPTDTMAHVRFVNAISNSNPLNLVVKSQATGSSEIAITAAPVAYKSASAFVTVPPSVYDLYARNAGASTNAFTRTGVSLSAGRVYTITARGDITITSSTAASRPQFDLTANY